MPKLITLSLQRVITLHQAMEETGVKNTIGNTLRFSEPQAAFKKISRILFGMFAVGLIVLDGRKFIQDLSFGSTLHLLRTFAPSHLIGFFGISLIAVGLTCLYDLIAVRRLRLPIPLLRIMKVSWIANTFNNIAGLGGLGGAGVRMLMYKAEAVPDSALHRLNLLIIPAAITGLGSLMLLNMTGLTGANILIREYRWLPLLILGFAVYIPVYCWFTDIQFTGFRLTLSHSPDRGETHTRLMLTAVSALDWTAAACVLWFIINSLHPGITLLQTAGLFSLATAAGITSMIPGGLGTFDLMLISGLQIYGATSEESLASLLLFRFFYYAVPVLIGAVLAVGELSPAMLHLGKGVLQILLPADYLADAPPAAGPSVLMKDFASKALSFLIFSGGLLLIVSAATPGLPDRVRYLSDLFSMPLLQLSHRVSLFIGLCMLLLADEIRFRIRRAWIACLLLLGSGGIFTFLKGLDFEELLFLMLVFILLWLSRDVFQRLSTPIGPERLLKPIFLTSLMAGFYILAGQPHPIAFLKTHGGISMLHFTASDYISNGMAALALSWAGYAVWLLTMEKPPLGDLPPSLEDFSKLDTLLQRYDGNSHTHLLFLGDKRFFWTAADTVLIPYQKAGDCMIALGAPLGNPAHQAAAITHFRSFSERYGLTPVLYQVSGDLLPLLHDQGFDFFKLGEEAWVDLTEFDLAHPHFKGLRNVRNRIERDGFIFSILEPSQTAACMAELRRVSDAWLEGRREKQFSLGFFDEPYVLRSPVALIRSPEGTLIAFATLMPGYQGLEALSVDLMRFLPESPNGIMDYLFLRLLLWAGENGYRRFNLGMAPLANVGRTAFPDTAERIGGFMFDHGSRLYSFEGLYQYKKKFRPVWQPRYLAYPRKGNLTRILVQVANLINRGSINRSR